MHAPAAAECHRPLGAACSKSIYKLREGRWANDAQKRQFRRAISEHEIADRRPGVQCSLTDREADS